ncbi:PepSY domain-containing protein [Fundicoccus sp. Sow4_H7]|uniref:PepSY domain-containing protein n=1 Tax=Fundicoccus sp. Sow4_H7 TaxID=3438784 RepID=UPI003F93C822
MKKTFKKFVMLTASVTALGASLPVLVNAQDDASSESTESVEESTADEAEASDLQLALELALDLFYEQVPDIGVTEIDIDLNDDGSYDIDIQGVNADGEYEYELRVSGEEVSNENFERDDDDDDDDEILDLENYLSIDEITKIALDAVGSGKVTDWTLDFDDNKPVWDLDIDEVDGDDDDVEITIHAETGEILDTDGFRIDESSDDDDRDDDDDDDDDDDNDDD